jgi:ATP adenylyltransferase
MTFEQLWAGWRRAYVENAAGNAHSGDDLCVFCAILDDDSDDEEMYVLWRGTRAAAILNAFPYTSGHLMVMPYRHVGEMEEIDPEEGMDLLRGATKAVRALKAAYSPQGVNVGTNIGAAAGAGIPGHFHIHVLPRWAGDTNFMTTIAGVRVLPESLPDTYRRLRDAWPS